MDMIPPLTPAASYASEIQSMIFGFSACYGLPETAALLEEIVNDQMKLVLHKASDVAERRGGKTVTLEDLLFLLRKNPVKLQRLIQYLGVKDTAATALNSDPQQQAPEYRRVRRCREFLARIDGPSGLLLQAANGELHDTVKLEKLKRMDAMSRTLDGNKYVEFTKARQVSFLGYKLTRAQKFSDWLLKDCGGWLELKVDKSALEVFSFLAYMTVGQLVELSLLARSDMDGESRDVSSIITFNPQFPMVQVAADDKAAGVKSGHNEEVQQPKLLETRPLTAQHVREAVRRLQQMPRSAFGWFDRIDSAHQKSETEIPLLAL